MALEAARQAGGTLADLIDRILDKGLVINADIQVTLAGVELLGIKVRAALSSFETAARWGLEFPSGINREAAAWRETQTAVEPSLLREEGEPIEKLDAADCPWCGGASAKGRASAP